MKESLTFTNSALNSGDSIPRMYTCDGENLSPHLSWSNVPEGTKSLALIVDDPDAPRKTFVHWVLFNIPPKHDVLTQGLDLERHFGSDTPALEGVNDFGNKGYGGPCPPRGDDTHRYYFRLYALDTMLDLGAGVTKHQLTQAMEGHILAETNLIGTYRRSVPERVVGE